MRFGISEHLAGSPGFYYTNKGCDTEGKYKGIPYDGSNPAYAELYYDQTITDTVFQGTWFLQNEDFCKQILTLMKTHGILNKVTICYRCFMLIIF